MTLPAMQELELTKKQARADGAERSAECAEDVFAKELSLYKLFWLFLTVSFLGCMVEMVFMLLTRGTVQNRSGVLYGPFSLVWGLGAVLFTLCFHKFPAGRNFPVFLAGTVLGAVYEYVCSWVQEVLFGACFWDYSHLPLNINGRVNLVFSMFWGLAAVFWVGWAYPGLCRWIGHIPRRMRKGLTIVVAVLMLCNITLTAAALGRMDRRNQGVPAGNAIERFLDRTYPDRVLQNTFTNLTYIGTDAAREAAGVPRPNDIPGK